MANDKKTDMTSPEFCCLDLNGGRVIRPLKAVLEENKTGFHAFYTHASLVSGVAVSAQGSSPQAIEQCFGRATKVLVNQYLDKYSGSEEQSPENDPADPEKPLVLIGDFGTKSSPSVVQQFFQMLREQLNGGKFRDRAGYSLNHSMVWDLFLERERYSGIIPGAQGYHEYLLWDTGGLIETSDLTDKDAWMGAGWISSRLRKNKQAGVTYPDPTELTIWARQANENLAQSYSALAKHYDGQPERNIYCREPWNNYVRTLCEFLPFHNSLSNNRPVPSNGLGDPGGPMVWRGLLDNRLHMHKRHLLLDGWLTLWPHREDEELLYVQPGSLALLYWAAKRADMPHTGKPTDFVEHYQWNDAPWFGGRWPPKT